MSATSDDILPGMLMRLKLSAMGERLDNLLDEAARRDLSLREALALLCEAEVQHREERRVRMGTGIAKFPFVRTASRSTRSPRSTASRFAASPPVAGLPTAIHCCCWGRPNRIHNAHLAMSLKNKGLLTAIVRCRATKTAPLGGAPHALHLDVAGLDDPRNSLAELTSGQHFLSDEA